MFLQSRLSSQVCNQTTEKFCTSHIIKKTVSTCFQKNKQDFLSSPVVKILCFQCKEHRFDPWSANKVPTCPAAWPKIKSIKKGWSLNPIWPLSLQDQGEIPGMCKHREKTMWGHGEKVPNWKPKRASGLSGNRPYWHFVLDLGCCSLWSCEKTHLWGFFMAALGN